MGSKNNNSGSTGSGSFRDSGEFKESKQQGTAESRQKQKDIGRKTGQELKDAIARGTANIKGTKYTGKLAETMMRQNIDQFNQRQRRQRALQNAPQTPGFGQSLKSFGKGIMSNISPQSVLGTALGTALLGPFGGILGGLIGRTYADDDPSNNFFGKIGQNLKQDFTDTINFFKPEQRMINVMPMKRPTIDIRPSMIGVSPQTLNPGFLESDLIDPSMRGDYSNLVNPDLDFGKMAPAGTTRRSMYDATGGSFGVNLTQPQNFESFTSNETFTMPERNKFMDYGTMPRVTSAPLGTSSTPINAVDMFGNPITTGVNTFDPSVDVQSLGTADPNATFSGQVPSLDYQAPMNMVGVNLANLANQN